jgi:hypothetical protein
MDVEELGAENGERLLREGDLGNALREGRPVAHKPNRKQNKAGERLKPNLPRLCIYSCLKLTCVALMRS